MMPRNDGEPMRGIRVYQQEKIMFDIQEELKKLPSKPGVYLMHNAQDEIIYVGKARILKNRVRQYFQSQKNHTAKVRAMVSNICDFSFSVRLRKLSNSAI